MERRRFEAVFFDLGNTLVYFDGPWSELVIEMYQQLYLSLIDSGLDLPQQAFTQDFRSQMEVYHARRETDFREYTTLAILKKVLEGWGYPAEQDEELKSAIAAMYAVSQRHWQIEEDTLQTLQILGSRGYHLGIISNAGDDADVQMLIDNAGIRSYFDLILTSAGESIRKPDPYIFRKALDHWSVKPHQAVMVGDTLNADILGANNTGLFSIWINRRVDIASLSQKEKSIQPDAIISSLDELPPLLEKLEW
jgi:HAD superfamily hydrolase (TIGR01662 family)